MTTFDNYSMFQISETPGKWA